MASFTKITDLKRNNRDIKKAANRAKKLKKTLEKNKKDSKLVKL